MDSRTITSPLQGRARRQTSRRPLALLALLGGCAFFASPAVLALEVDPRAQETETKVKVAYVYNFPKFIEWPGDDKSEGAGAIRLCVIGTDPIHASLEHLAGREINGRPIEVAHVEDPSTPLACHLLFITRSEEARLPLVLHRVGGTPTLTISDIPRFAQRGGMIGLVNEAGRVRLEINHGLVRLAGLRVSAKVLEIARVVR